jgi:ribosome-associated heat shock protein Hsp15
MTAEDRRRIDKWLWYARLVKSRTAAQALAVSGRVRVNSVKNDSASRPLKTGDVLTVALDSGVRVLRVLLLGERRGPAPEARLLYEDLSPPATPPEPGRLRLGPRPTKRDRRRLEALQADRPGEDFPPQEGGSE